MSVVVQVLQHCHYITLHCITLYHVTLPRTVWPMSAPHPMVRAPGLQVSTRTQLAMGSRAIADGLTALSAHSNKCAHVHCKGWPHRLSSRGLPVPLALTKAGMWEELTLTKPDGVAMLRTEPLVMGRPDGVMVVGGLSLLCGEPMTAIWPPGPSGNTGCPL